MKLFDQQSWCVVSKDLRSSSLVAYITVAVMSLGTSVTQADDKPESKEAESAVNLYIITPGNGYKVTSPVTVRFGLKGMGVAPAGVDKPNTGHHHLLIDVDKLPDLSLPIPADEHHRHFGGGQTEVTLDLSPGKHKLQLVLANHSHIPHNPPIISKPVTVFVVSP